MRRWMKVVFCFLFGIIFTNMFTMDQAVAEKEKSQQNHPY